MSLPWAEIRDTTRAASAEIAKHRRPAAGGRPPRSSLCGGRNHLSASFRGVSLLYVKSSITGDENDYIVDYKRRFPTYPHETTADQLFSEEQFEAYRALGFHAVNEVFQGNDHVAMRPEPPMAGYGAQRSARQRSQRPAEVAVMTGSGSTSAARGLHIIE